MDLSIIIVNYRGWKRLRECLDALVSFSDRVFKSEVIIVDNDSADGKLDEFKSVYPNFVFILNKGNGGFANGCNLGSTLAKGDYLLFLNPDTVASETEVAKLIERAKENPQNYISSCHQVNENGKVSKAFGFFPGFGTLTGFGRVIYRSLNKNKIKERKQEKDNAVTVDWVSGSVMLIKKEVFRNLQGFDEDFWMYYEDTDLCKRARDGKGEIVFYTDITIEHNHGGSSRINNKTTSLTKTEVIISSHLYISKHESGISRFLLQSYLVLYNLVAGTFMAFLGIVFFFIPKLLLRANIYRRLVGYYFNALARRSWISPRSVNFIENV